MWPSILLILLLLLVWLILWVAFLPIFVVVGLNGLLLYLAGVRIWVELKKGREKEYAVAAVLSLLASVSFRNWFPLWSITTFVVQTLLLSYVVRFFEKLFAPEKKQKKRRR